MAIHLSDGRRSIKRPRHWSQTLPRRKKGWKGQQTQRVWVAKQSGGLSGCRFLSDLISFKFRGEQRTNQIEVKYWRFGRQHQGIVLRDRQRVGLSSFRQAPRSSNCRRLVYASLPHQLHALVNVGKCPARPAPGVRRSVIWMRRGAFGLPPKQANLLPRSSRGACRGDTTIAVPQDVLQAIDATRSSALTLSKADRPSRWWLSPSARFLFCDQEWLCVCVRVT